ncbi:MAG TPA: gas vesicle protein [Acidimicrobiales bacterium]
MSVDQPTTYRRGGITRAPQSANLADVLERVLDKGLVVAGDIRINLLDIELLTIKLRLLVASADKAAEMGITWWRHDPFLSGDGDGRGRDLEARVAELESRLAELPAGAGTAAGEGKDEAAAPARPRRTARKRS